MKKKVNYQSLFRKNQRKKVKIAAKNRKCEQCAACCFTMVVEDLGKGQYEDCKFCKDSSANDCANGRCKIYLNRPDACEAFACLWLQGIMPLECRPDKFGVMLYTDDGTRLKQGVVIVNEIEELALEKPEVLALIKKISQIEIVYAVDLDKKLKIYCPESRRSEIDELIKQRTERSEGK